MFHLEESDNKKIMKVMNRNLTGAAKWRDIEDLINRWAKRNPKAAYQQEMWLKATRDTLFDKKHAKITQEYSGKHLKQTAETKYGTLIHPELLSYIEYFYPKIFSTKESLHEFMGHFQKFKIRREI